MWVSPTLGRPLALGLHFTLAMDESFSRWALHFPFGRLAVYLKKKKTYLTREVL